MVVSSVHFQWRWIHYRGRIFYIFSFYLVEGRKIPIQSSQHFYCGPDIRWRTSGASFNLKKMIQFSIGIVWRRMTIITNKCACSTWKNKIWWNYISYVCVDNPFLPYSSIIDAWVHRNRKDGAAMNKSTLQSIIASVRSRHSIEECRSFMPHREF